MRTIRIDEAEVRGNQVVVMFTVSARNGSFAPRPAKTTAIFDLAAVKQADVSELLSSEHLLLLALRQWLLADQSEKNPSSHLKGKRFEIDVTSLKEK